MEQDSLSVSIVQAELHWHDIDANISSIQKEIEKVDKTDLILLPEMWSSGFTLSAHKCHQRTTECLELMHSWSQSKEAVVIGSLITKVDDSYVNRAYVVYPGGVTKTYDKRHLFAFAGEDRIFSRGEEQLIVDIKGWSCCVNVCYDLRFPVWSRNTTDYDILLYVANWPEKRSHAWKTLLKARAIENQCYVLGGNCVGNDAWQNEYLGNSAIISPLGEVKQTLVGQNGLLQAKLEREELREIRRKFPFLKDRDSFSLDS